MDDSGETTAVVTMELLPDSDIRQRHIERFAQAVRELRPRYGFLSLALLSDIEVWGIALRAGIQAGFFANPKWTADGVDDAPPGEAMKWGKRAWDLYLEKTTIDPN